MTFRQSSGEVSLSQTVKALVSEQSAPGTTVILGGETTVHLILLHCITNDVDIDTSYNTSFSAEIECQEGEWCVFKPTGTVRIKNDDAGEQSTVEYWVFGV